MKSRSDIDVIAKACLRQGSFAPGNPGMSTTGGRPAPQKRDSDAVKARAELIIRAATYLASVPVASYR